MTELNGGPAGPPFYVHCMVATSSAGATVKSMLISHPSEIDALSALGSCLVDFAAEWCGPCKQLAVSLEQFTQDHPETPVFTVDVDQLPELAQMFNVMSVPTILVMRSGAVVGRLVGARSASRLSEEVAALL